VIPSYESSSLETTVVAIKFVFIKITLFFPFRRKEKKRKEKKER